MYDDWDKRNSFPKTGSPFFDTVLSEIKDKPETTSKKPFQMSLAELSYLHQQLARSYMNAVDLETEAYRIARNAMKAKMDAYKPLYDVEIELERLEREHGIEKFKTRYYTLDEEYDQDIPNEIKTGEEDL